MTTYQVTVPPTNEMGSYTTIVRDNFMSPAKEALRYYNDVRNHDGLLNLQRMPKGTKYKQLKSVRGKFIND